MAKTIEFGFDLINRYRCLSNMYGASMLMEVDGKTQMFFCVDQFVAYHISDEDSWRERILGAWDSKSIVSYWTKPRGLAKAEIKLPKKWEDRARELTEVGVKAKLEQNMMTVGVVLRKSKDSKLVHANKWDEYWGTGKEGEGRNKLGKLWMSLRDKMGEG